MELRVVTSLIISILISGTNARIPIPAFTALGEVFELKPEGVYDFLANIGISEPNMISIIDKFETEDPTDENGVKSMIRNLGIKFDPSKWDSAIDEQFQLHRGKFYKATTATPPIQNQDEEHVNDIDGRRAEAAGVVKSAVKAAANKGKGGKAEVEKGNKGKGGKTEVEKGNKGKGGNEEVEKGNKGKGGKESKTATNQKRSKRFAWLNFFH